MKILFPKTILVSLTVLLFAACGKKTDELPAPVKVTIPDSPDAAVQTVISEFAKGDSGIAWRALPESYQSDINGLMHLAGSKMDQEVYEKSFSLIARLGEIIQQQKSFILNSSFMQEQPPEELSKLEAVLPSIAGLINTFATSELSSTAGLIHFDGQTFFDTTVAKCVEYLETIGQLTSDGTKLSEYASTVVSVVDADEQRATLLIAIPGQEAEEMTFTKVGERWVPVELEDSWAETIEEMKKSLEAYSPEEFEAQKTQILGALTMFDGILTKFSSAQTQEEFNQSLKDSTMPLMSIFMMLNQATKGTN